MKETESFYPRSRQQWRTWLAKNHDKKESVWLICYKKDSHKPSIPWSDFVDEALCFGWIDSIRKPIDHEKFMQRFSRRKPKSTWSKINKQKVKHLIKTGRMTEAGLAVIAVAKKNGYWSILDDVEELTIPEDLNRAFKKKPGSKKYFESLSRSKRRLILVGLVMTKRSETRTKRIDEIVENCTT